MHISTIYRRPHRFFHYLSIAFVGVLATMALFAAGSPCRADEAQDCVKRGQALFEEGKYQDALLQYQRAQQLNSGWSEPYRLIGRIYRAQGRLYDAISEYHIALAKDPNSALAHNDLGAALQQKGTLDTAMEEFRAALKSDPHMVEASYNVACVLFEKNRVDEAISTLQSTIRLDPKSALLYYGLAVALGKAERWPEAVKAAEHATKYDGSSASYWLFLAWSNYQIGSVEHARDLARRGVSKDTKRADGQYLLGFLETANHNLDGAITAYQQGVALDPKESLEKAIVDLRHDLVPDEKTPEAEYSLGLLLQAQNDRSGARDAYQAYLSRVHTGKWIKKAQDTLESLK